MITRASAVVVIGLSVACSGGSKESCEARTKTMGERFRAVMGPSGIEARVPSNVSVPKLDRAQTSFVKGAAIGLDSSGIRFGYRQVSLGEVKDMVEVETARSGANPPVYISADAKLSVGRLAELAAEIPVSSALRLVVELPDNRKLPYDQLDKRVRETVDKLRVISDPSQKATKLAEEIQGSITGCSDLIKSFGKVAGMDAADKGNYMAKSVPKSIYKCGCKGVDIDLFEGLMIATFDTGAPKGWVDVPRSKLKTATGSIEDFAKTLTN